MKTLGWTAGIALGMALVGCAAAPPPVVESPSMELAAAVVEAPTHAEESASETVEPAPAPAERVRHHVEITVDALPADAPHAAKAAPGRYVVWVRASEEEAWANAGSLQVEERPQTLELGYPENVLNVEITAEAEASPRRPSSDVLASARVSKLAACASTVDENGVKMRVRMCRDE